MSASTLDRADSTPEHGDPAGPGRDHYRPALVALLAATAVLYLWGLGASGWANSFYSAAVQAGSESWTAFFFGSSDAANAITVDKTPLSLWPMALSVRVFGLSSWAILVPQAIEGVLAVWLLTATVRRSTGSGAAGLVAGAALATTPVAALMFRFNNPDAMLVLLLVAAAYAVLRAVEDGVRHPVRWLALAGALVGLAFLAKMLQAFLVLPAFALVYLVAARTGLPRRVGHLLVAFGSMVAAAGWWIAIVTLWPAASRPYIGGSQSNSILELTLGYNGLGRLTGEQTGAVVGGGGQGGAGGTGGRWGETGLTRLLDADIGGQVAWLLPSALLLLVAGLWWTRRAPRTDGVRAALLLWGGWLVVTALTFSLMAGIFHSYYPVALAPAIAALVGIGGRLAWERRRTADGAAVGAVAVGLVTVTAVVLLGRSPDFVPWLRWAVLALGLLAAVAVAAVRWLSSRSPARRRTPCRRPRPRTPDRSRPPARPWTRAPEQAVVDVPVATARPGPDPAVCPVACPVVCPVVLPAGDRAGRACPADRRADRRAHRAGPRAARAVPAVCSRPASPARHSPPCCCRTPTTTPGSPPRLARTLPRATSWPPRSR